MAETNEEVLITIKISEEEVEKKILGAREALVRLRKEKSELEKDYKSGAISANEYARSQQAIETQISRATSEISKGQKTLASYEQSQKAAQGSLVQMRSQLSLLTEQYIHLSKAERDAAQGQDLQKQIRSLSDELKGNEKELGNNSRNVGNYIKDINIMGVSVGQAEEAFKGGFEASKVFAKGIATTGGALKALIAIPIIALLVGLVALFKSTDEGADKLAQGVAFLSAGFESLLKGIAPLGKLLLDTFTSPLETIKKLIAGTDEYTVSLTGVAGAAIRAGLAQAEYTKTMQDLEDRQDALIGVQAKVNEQVQLALLAVKDRSKSERERIGLLDAAGNAERKLSKETVAIKKAEYDALKKLQSQKDNLQDDDRKASRQAYADYVNARSASLQTEQAIQNRRSALLEQEAADQKAASDKAKEAAKEAAQERVAEAERALIQARKNGLETLKFEEEIIRRRASLEQIGLKKNSQQRKLIQAKAEADILKLRVDAAIQADDVLFATEEAKLGARLALVRKGSDEEYQLSQQLLDAKLLQEKSAAVESAKLQPQTLANKKALTTKLRLIDAKYNADTEQLERSFQQGQINRDAQLEELWLQTIQNLGVKTLDAQREIDEKRIDQEEKTQLALLKLEDLTESDRLVKQNAIQAAALARHKELNKQYELADLDSQQRTLAARLAAVRQGSDAEYRLRLQDLELQKKKEIAEAKGTQEEIEKAKKDVTDKYNAEQKKLTKEHIESVVSQTLDALNQGTQTLSSFVDASVARQTAQLDQQYQAILSSASLSADARTKIEAEYQKKKDKLEKEAAEKRRKIASIENIINTAASISKAFATAGPIVGAILAALAVAQGVAQQVVIDNQKFAKGGLVNGPSHAAGGVKYRVGSRTIELEGGEAIINKKSTAKFFSQLSAINADGGNGIPFAGVGRRVSTTPMLNTQHILPKFQYGGTATFIDTYAISNAIRQGMQGIDIRVGVDEVTKKQNGVKYAETFGTI